VLLQTKHQCLNGNETLDPAIDCPRSLVLDLLKANSDILIGLPALADLFMDEIANLNKDFEMLPNAETIALTHDLIDKDSPLRLYLV
jgi:hypothetical protein